MIRDDSLSATGPGLPGHRDAMGKPSIVPKFREIRKNFIIGVYNSQVVQSPPPATQYIMHRGPYPPKYGFFEGRQKSPINSKKTSA